MEALPACRNHADRAAETLCSRCADLICGLCAIRLEGRDHCPGCAPRVRADLVSFGPYVPWEDRARLGTFQAWWQTVTAVFTRPVQFAERLPLEGGMADPILFGMIMRGMSVIFYGIFFAALYLIAGIVLQQPELFLNAAVQAVALVWNIPMAAAFLLVIAGMIHLGVVLVGGSGRGFEATLRLYCYGRAADILDLVPILGQFVSLFYRVYLYFLGFQRFVSGTALQVALKSLFLATLPILVYVFSMLFLTGVVIVIVLLVI